jgi:TPR repeat protein
MNDGLESASDSLLLKKAESGDPEAQFALARLILNGSDRALSHEKAFGWVRKAASQGLIKAQALLGSMYFRGVGTPQDFPKAVSWYLKAAEQGDPESAFHVGFMYHMGLGVLKNHTLAAIWQEKSYSKGMSRSLINRLKSFVTDQGGEISLGEARRRFLIDAEAGDPVAQYNLGIMSLLGQGSPADLAEAKLWFRKAADGGHNDAALNLSHLEAHFEGGNAGI